ncbi:MAG: FAD-dependent oxidoreductase [Burkholderiales bacterium]|nr:FAD-dependent oxidoreductase [Burkholderiales bacterium]
MLLQQPGRLGALVLKNRVTLAPLGTNYSTSDGMISERDKLYYGERARGGVAMIMTAAMGVSGEARAHRFTPVCYHDRFIPGLASLVETIKAHDCHVFGQLNHHGALLHEPGMPPVGPSPWLNPKTGEAVRAMALEEIHAVQVNFATAARRLWVAGYDGVEVHAANGYLFQQFFTPRINKRTDAYGGSAANRMRLLLETVARIRDAAPELLVMVRFSVSEFTAGGYGEDDVIALAQALQAAGVVALDLSAGTNESPRLSRHCIQTPSFPRGCLAPYAKPIKAAVSIPVMVAGRIVTPEDADAVLASGSADFISLGRALYADPHWCLKAFGQMKAPIRQCIACNVCHDRLSAELDVCCVQNPMIGTAFETRPQVEPDPLVNRTARPKRVLVIGAGVAGIETARLAAGRGHRVEVWEKSNRAGGQIPLALAAPHKQEVASVWSYRWQQIERLDVPVRTSTALDPDRIRAFGPDLVIVATGAVPREMPPLPGSLDARITVLPAWDFLARPEAVGSRQHVTIVGGGSVGLEAADLLVARDCRVTLIEAASTLGAGMARSNRMELLDRLAAARVRIHTDVEIVRYAGGSLVVRSAAQGEQSIEVGDWLMIAVGARPNLDVIDAVEAAGVPYVRVGDCYQPGDFMSVLRDAWMAGLAVDRYAERPVSTPPMRLS